MKHTSGPWEIYHGSGIEKTISSTRFFTTIAVLPSPTNLEAMNAFEEEQTANAELIARAPELLEENETLKEQLRLANLDKESCGKNLQGSYKEVESLKSINKELLEAFELILPMIIRVDMDYFLRNSKPEERSGHEDGIIAVIDMAKSVIAKAKL